MLQDGREQGESLLQTTQMNLLPVEARLNRQKKAKGPDDWLPPKNQCLYFKMFERIKNAYALTYSVTEKSEMARIKARVCGST